MERVAIGSGRRPSELHGDAAQVQRCDDERRRLDVHHRTRTAPVRRPGTGTLPGVQGPDVGRVVVHERHDVLAGHPARLRRVGAAGQRGLGVRRRATVLRQVRKLHGRPAAGRRASRPRRPAHRQPAGFHRPGVLVHRGRQPVAPVGRTGRHKPVRAAGHRLRSDGLHGARRPQV